MSESRFPISHFRFPILVGTLLLVGCETTYPVSPFDEARFKSVDTLTLNPATTQPTTRPATQPAKSVRLSLVEARERALRNNLDLAVARLDPAIAKSDVSAEEASFEAVFTTRFDYANLDQPTGSTLNSAQSTRWAIAPGISIPLRTGGTIGVELPIARSDSDNQFNTLNPAWDSDLTFSVSQPLLRGAGRDVTEQRIRVARYQEQQSLARTKLEVIRVLAEVDRAYWRLEAARQLLLVRVQERDLAQQQLDRVVRQLRAQVVAEVERVRAEAGVSDRVEAIILAETDVKQRQRELKALLNDPELPVESTTIVELDAPPEALALDVSVPELLDRALNGRMELLDVELSIAAQTANVLAARNATLPLVSLEYRYGINGLGPTFPAGLPTDLDYQDHRVGLQVEIPIGNEAARNRLRAALDRRLQLLSTRSQRELTVRRDILDAVDRLDRDWQRVLAARQRVTLNERLLAAETRQFDQQLRTSTEVLEAQANLADARAALVSARVDYQISQIDLAYATGLTLGATGVEVDVTR
jgi:outer membrane protein